MKRAVRPDDVPKPVMHYSSSIVVGDLIFTSGALATDYRTGLAPEADLPYYGSNMKQQTQVVFRAINKLVSAGGAKLDNVVKVEEYFDDTKDAAAYLAERDNILGPRSVAATTVLVNPFIIPICNLEVDAIAFTDASGFSKEVISTSATVQGPEAQAVKAGPWVFVSNLMATDYVEGVAPEAQVNPNNWYGSPVKAQARFIFKQLEAILDASGSSLDHVVKVRVDLLDLNDFTDFENVWQEVFGDNPPARTIVKPNGIGSEGCKLQVSVIAVTKDGPASIEVVTAGGIAPQLTHEPHAVKAGGLLFLSGQMPFDEKGLADSVKLHPAVPYYGQSVKLQMAYAIERAQAICEAAGSSLDNMVKRSVFHTDITELDQSFELWKSYFKVDPPASTTVEIEGPHLVPGSTILLDLICATPS